MDFEYDNDKAAANLNKHAISFDEATTVFDDLFNIDFYDSVHAESEHRFIVIGESDQKRLVIVSYTERADRIRIISARKVTAKERRDYEQGRFE